MDKYRETFETWNKVASLYQDKFMGLDIYDHTYDFICSSLTKHAAKILDIGCGPGNITKYLLSSRPDLDILGIDIAPAMIDLAKKNNPAARFDIMDTRHIDEIKTKFDAITCGFCLPYLSEPDTRKLIKDCYDLLNDEGLIYISYVEGNPDQSGYKSASTGDRTFFYYYNLDALEKYLSLNNFGRIKSSTVNYKRNENETETHTILTARKI